MGEQDEEKDEPPPQPTTLRSRVAHQKPMHHYMFSNLRLDVHASLSGQQVEGLLLLQSGG